jgi:hypothetical protein
VSCAFHGSSPFLGWENSHSRWSSFRGLGQLEETIYAVAAAKFAAERCDGVGEETRMFVTWKRRSSDPERKLAGNFVQPDKVQELRKLWEKYGKPSVPEKGWNLLSSIATGLFEGRGRQIQLQHIIKEAKANKRLRKSKQSIFQKSEAEK